MKRSKILIPTLSALAVTPAIALVGCNQTSPEQSILDCVFKPITIKQSHKDDFETAYKEEMSIEEKKQELIYDAFGNFNRIRLDNSTETIRNLWLNKNEGAFKVNIAEANVEKKNDKFIATLRGYIAYVFAQEHTTLIADQTITMKADDFIMVTYQFKNVEVKVQNDGFNFASEVEGAIVGIVQYKYNAGAEEVISPIERIVTYNWDVPNSKNWSSK